MSEDFTYLPEQHKPVLTPPSYIFSHLNNRRKGWGNRRNGGLTWVIHNTRKPYYILHSSRLNQLRIAPCCALSVNSWKVGESERQGMTIRPIHKSWKQKLLRSLRRQQNKTHVVELRAKRPPYVKSCPPPPPPPPCGRLRRLPDETLPSPSTSLHLAPPSVRHCQPAR